MSERRVVVGGGGGNRRISQPDGPSRAAAAAAAPGQQAMRTKRSTPAATSTLSPGEELLGRPISAAQVASSEADILRQQLKIALADVSRQKLRNMHIQLRRLADVDARVKPSDLFEMFKEHDFKISPKTFQLIVNQYSDPFGIEHEPLWRLIKDMHSRTGRDSVQAKYQKSRASEERTLTLQGEEDAQLLEQLKKRFAANTLTQFSVSVFEEQLEQLDYNKAGVLPKKEVRKVTESLQLPIYGQLVAQLYNRCDQENNAQINWMLMLNFLEAAKGGSSCRVTVEMAQKQEEKEHVEIEIDQEKIEEFKRRQQEKENTQKAIITGIFGGKKKGIFSALKGNLSAAALSSSEAEDSRPNTAGGGNQSSSSGLDLKSRLQAAAAIRKQEEAKEAGIKAISSLGTKENISVYEKRRNSLSEASSHSSSRSNSPAAPAKKPAAPQPTLTVTNETPTAPKQPRRSSISLNRPQQQPNKLSHPVSSPNLTTMALTQQNGPRKQNNNDYTRFTKKSSTSSQVVTPVGMNGKSTDPQKPQEKTTKSPQNNRKVSGISIIEPKPEPEPKISSSSASTIPPNSSSPYLLSVPQQPLSETEDQKEGPKRIESPTIPLPGQATAPEPPPRKTPSPKVSVSTKSPSPDLNNNKTEERAKQKSARKTSRDSKKSGDDSDTTRNYPSESEGTTSDSKYDSMSLTSSLSKSSLNFEPAAKQKPKKNRVRVAPLDLTPIVTEEPPKQNGPIAEENAPQDPNKKMVVIKDESAAKNLNPRAISDRKIITKQPVDNEFNEPIYPPAPKTMKPAVIQLDGASQVKVWPPDSLSLKVIEPQRTDKKLNLSWIYGYRGNDCRSNLFTVASGEILYNVSTFAILLEPNSWTQRIYREHHGPIKSVAMHPNGVTIATGQDDQIEKSMNSQKAHIRIWDCITLQTSHVIKHDYIRRGISALAFTNEKNMLVSLDDNNTNEGKRLCVWGCKDAHLLISAVVEISVVCNMAAFVSPNAETVWVVTAGKDHVMFHFYDHTAQSISSHIPEFGSRRDARFYVTCAFNKEGNLFLGDSNGTVLRWETEQRISETLSACHEGSVFCTIFPVPGVMLTGGRDGNICAFVRQNGAFVKSNTFKMPENHGACRMMTVRGDRLLIGSTANSIISTPVSLSEAAVAISPEWSFVTQGHYEQIRGITTLRNSLLGGHFVTAGYDGMVVLINSDQRRIVWKHALKNTAPTCIDVHHDSSVVAMGTKDGSLVLVKVRGHANSSEVKVKVAKDKINCIKFSKDYLSVALGSQDGNVYVFRSRDFSLFDSLPPEQLVRCCGVSGPVVALDWSAQLRQGHFILRCLSLNNHLTYYNAGTAEAWSECEMRNVSWVTCSCMYEFNTSGLMSSLRNVTGTSVTGDTLCAGTIDGTIAVADYPCLVSSSNVAPVVRRERAFHCRVSGVELVRENCLVAIGASDHSIQQWQCATS